MLEAVLGLNLSPFKTGLEEAKEQAKETRNELGQAFIGAVGIGGVGEMINKSMEYADKVGDLSERFGTSTTALQQYGNVAEQNGASMETVAKSFNKLEIAKAKAMRGDEEVLGAFSRLGVTLEDLKSKPIEQIFEQLGHGSMNAADMVTVLGKSGNDLSVTLEALSNGTAKLGSAMDEMTIKTLKAAADGKKALMQDVQVGFGTAIANMGKMWADFWQIAGGGKDSNHSDEEMKLRAIDETMSRLLTKRLRLQDAGKWDQANKARDQYDALSQERDDILHPAAKRQREEEEETAKFKLTLAEKLARVDEEAMTKKLALEEQLAALRAKESELTEKLAGTKDLAEAKTIEDEILASRKEQWTVVKAIDEAQKQSEEKALAARVKQAEQQERAEKELAKNQFENLTPLEKQKELLHELAGKNLRLAHPEMESELTLTQVAGDKERILHDLKKNQDELIRSSQPNFDSLKQMGGGYAGVNYDTRGDYSEQRNLLEEIMKNTAEALNKQLTVKMEQASFGGGGSPSGGTTQ